MNTELDIGGLIGAGLACAIGIPIIVFAIRHDYRKRGISDQFSISRVAIAFAILGAVFFGLLATGVYFQSEFRGAGAAAVVVGYLVILFGGVAFIKKKKKK